jgi:hypothetical protein
VSEAVQRRPDEWVPLVDVYGLIGGLQKHPGGRKETLADRYEPPAMSA